MTPLRWAIRQQGPRPTVQLYDDRGIADSPIVSYFPFEAPCVETALPLNDGYQYQVESPGGLYLVRSDESSTCLGIIVPVGSRNLGFEDLKLEPTIERQNRSIESVVKIIQVANLWNTAKLSGDLLSNIRRREVMYALSTEVSRLLGGNKWAEVEKDFINVGSLKSLEQLYDAVSSQSSLGLTIHIEANARIAENCESIADYLADLALKERLLKYSSRPMEYNHRWLTELSLRLASDPGGVPTWAGDGLWKGLSRLLEIPALFRASRFLVLRTDQLRKSPTAGGELFADWKWS